MGFRIIFLLFQRFPAYLLSDFSGKFVARSSGSAYTVKVSSALPDSLASPKTFQMFAMGDPPYVISTFSGMIASRCSFQMRSMSLPSMGSSPGRFRSLVETNSFTMSFSPAAICIKPTCPACVGFPAIPMRPICMLLKYRSSCSMQCSISHAWCMMKA